MLWVFVCIFHFLITCFHTHANPRESDTGNINSVNKTKENVSLAQTPLIPSDNGPKFINTDQDQPSIVNKQNKTQFAQVGFSEGELRINHNQTSSTISDNISTIIKEDDGPTQNFKSFNSNPSDSISISKSSVVARKGAEMEPSGPTNYSLNIQNNQTSKILTNYTSIFHSENISKTIKKPESASDITEDNDERFSFILSSSSGKDYVLTGIVIFICIWAVIFGALFFYKRAGEIWDRRHYRRMDFLVEGMYND